MVDKALSAETNQVTSIDGNERQIITDYPGGTATDGYILTKHVNRAFFLDPTEGTVSGGTLTLTEAVTAVQPQSGTTDDIDTIAASAAGIYFCTVADAGTDTLTYKNGTGNISSVNGNDVLHSGGLLVVHFDGTNAEVFGQSYLESELYNRYVNFNLTPDEHWYGGADALSWTGWATYTGYGTPSSISRTNSLLKIYHSGTTSAFYYRSYINGDQKLVSRLYPGAVGEAGLMVDDGGTAPGDGEGATNFVRLFAERTSFTNLINIVRENRAGGSAVSTGTLVANLPMNQFLGLQLEYGVGTRWTNWTAYFYVYGEMGAQYLGSVAALTWTPARHGLYYYGNSATVITSYDWFHEV